MSGAELPPIPTLGRVIELVPFLKAWANDPTSWAKAQASMAARAELEACGAGIALLLVQELDKVRALPIQPGEQCMHKSGGGPYTVLTRDIARWDHDAGFLVERKSDTISWQSNVKAGEQIVTYRRNDRPASVFVRSAANFDEPGRFVRIEKGD